MNRIRKIIENATRSFFNAADDGIGGGAGLEDTGSATATDDGGSEDNAFDNYGLPDDVMRTAMSNDPELQALQKEKKAKKNPKPSEDGSIVHPAEDENKPAPKGTQDQSVDEETEELEFADNVIPGVSGTELKKLDSATVEKLAEFYEEHGSRGKKLEEVTKRLETLLSDPVIKSREEMITSGKTEYSVRGVSAEERSSAIGLLKSKLDLTDQEAAGAFDLLKSGFEKIIKDSVEDHIHSRTIEESSRQKAEQTISKARSVFLSLGELNADLKFKETDGDKFWTKTKDASGKTVYELNEKHPEIEKFKTKVLPVMQAVAKAGFGYEQIVNMAEEFGKDAIYSLAAKKLGLPVAINTGERDKKMIQSELRKKLSPFLKSSGPDGLPNNGGSKSAPAKKAENIVDGIDVMRLASDEDYYDQVVSRKRDDSKHLDYVSELAEKGRRLLRQKKKSQQE